MEYAPIKMLRCLWPSPSALQKLVVNGHSRAVARIELAGRRLPILPTCYRCIDSQNQHLVLLFNRLPTSRNHKAHTPKS